RAARLQMVPIAVYPERSAKPIWPSVASPWAGMGHDVCATAATEAEAVSAATRYDPDLMIVDAGLGGGSGVSAVEEILRAGPLAHVFISGDAGRVRVRAGPLAHVFISGDAGRV